MTALMQIYYKNYCRSKNKEFNLYNLEKVAEFKNKVDIKVISYIDSL